ncbi:MAG: 5'-methylthioadenosine/S-adenosylhomocysteine nucleosidase, partial [Clostridia bacterium]|nr:5'-methylthioadenosine/S-adenosylhomocysteine nucleosidase [Clostridia bacterium]
TMLGKKVYQGKLKGKEITLMISGIGKVNSALSTQFLIDKFDVDYILNFGTCGALDENFNVGDIYIVKKAVQFDFDLTEIDKCPLGYMEEYDCIFFDCENDYLQSDNAVGTLATADQFSEDVNKIKTLKNMGCNLKDMEGGAIFQVCKANGKKLLMIKGVTDVFGQKSMIDQYLNNVRIVSQKLVDYVCELI